MDFLIQNGIVVSIGLGILAVIAAVVLALKVRSAATGTDLMREIAAAVEEGAKAYLSRQIKTISAIAVVLLVLIGIFKGMPTAIGFLIGATCSLLAGFIGMRIAVISNIRTAQAATIGAQPALRIAFNGGAVTGLLVVGLALLSVGGFYLGADAYFNHDPSHKEALSAIVGLALGSSLISVFARLGGGIYTKAADVGADLVGKIEQNLDEDDPRNPATIADNVGDNVGDCAGMAADVFETYAVSLIGCVLVAALLPKDIVHDTAPYIIFPFMLCGLSVIASVLGIVFINVGNLKPTNALLTGVALSAIIAGLLFLPLSWTLFPTDWVSVYVPTLVGLAMTFITVLITNYYTATQYAPVRKIAKASETGHATNIIAGLAVGLHATLFPVFFIGLSIVVSYAFHGLYGIAVAVVSMLSLSGIIISLDAFGPITDNAGGLAVMSKLPKEVRRITDELDAIGNTMKAVTKGYAIASAGLAALVLFSSYVNELQVQRLITDANAVRINFSLEDPTILIGLFIGGMLPFLFVAYTMDAVGKAAGAVVLEVRRQLVAKPGILTGEDKPEYGTCVDIVTKAALKEMIFPALLPILAVMLVAAVPALCGHFIPGLGLTAKAGATALGGVLVGTITTGLFVGISLTSSGGAWDNAKKYIEEGAYGGKGSPAHAAAVTGDTVGDPYKDTSGPAINPMIKVVNVLAILIIPLFF